jgi:hypothetical protein
MPFSWRPRLPFLEEIDELVGQARIGVGLAIFYRLGRVVFSVDLKRFADLQQSGFGKVDVVVSDSLFFGLLSWDLSKHGGSSACQGDDR